jgi:epoxyqueuosine reductase
VADPSPEALRDRIRELSASIGLARTGFARAGRLDRHATHLDAWLEAGHHGGMRYLQGPVDRADPRMLLPAVRSVIVVASPYAPGSAVAGYAHGEDYHLLLRRHLSALGRGCAAIAGRPVQTRNCIDTAPLLERAWAEQAGVGSFGSSTLLIVPRLGTRVVLGVLLVDLEIAPDVPIDPVCEGCEACLSACPTGALLAPFILDARRCLSYLTIEHAGSFPPELRAKLGPRVFGCDACQDACPHNPIRTPEVETHELAAWLEIGSAEYRRRVRGTALRRASRTMLARNAALALAHRPEPDARQALARAAATHPSDLVREHARWALGALPEVVRER